MSKEVVERFDELRKFMFQNVYLNPEAKREEQKAKHVVEMLYQYYLTHIDQIPSEFTANLDQDGPERIAADHIACMTDRYAITDYERLFVPKEWN